MTIQISLPWPPSVNRYWRSVPGRVLVSTAGREYRIATAWLCRRAMAGVKPLGGRLAVRLDAYPPDRRKRDLDNIGKAFLDALIHGGVYRDDSQIDRLEIIRGEPFPPSGRIDVAIEELAHV